MEQSIGRKEISAHISNSQRQLEISIRSFLGRVKIKLGKKNITSEGAGIEQWKHNVGRLIRRVTIESQLNRGKSLSDIKASVKVFEKDNKVDELISALVEKEFVVDPKMADVADDVSRRVRDKFPEVSAIILLGSSTHGGAGVRRLTGSPYEPDLDWGVISDEFLGKRGIEMIELVGSQ